MEKIIVRSALPDEAYDINTLVAQARSNVYRNDTLSLNQQWADALVANLMSPAQVNECRQNIVDASERPDRRLYIIAADIAIQGVLHAERHDEADEIVRYFVAEEGRGQGIGSKLMEFYEDWHKPGLATIVEVVAYNYAAVQMYERRGYRQTAGTAAHTWEDGITTIQMKQAKE